MQAVSRAFSKYPSGFLLRECVCVCVCGKSVYHFAVASCMAVQSFDVGCELLQAMPPPTPTNCIFICHMYSGDCRAPNYIVQVNLKHKLYQCGKHVCPLWAVFLNVECLSCNFTA